MPYTGGTTAARDCISKLQELGALVDVYSNKWLETNPDFCYFTKDELVDFQMQSNNACEGHLLLISTSLHIDVVSSLLTAAYPRFTAFLGDGSPHHKPDFIFINLATKQILCAGLGRKNYFFGYAIGDGEVNLSEGNIHEVISRSRDYDNTNPTLAFMSEFTRYDYATIVINLLESLYEFGVCARNWDHLPLTPDQIEEIIDSGPDNDGMYDIDDHSMTLEEAQEIIAEFEKTDEWGRENLSTIQAFFTELTWADLNTQDY